MSGVERGYVFAIADNSDFYIPEAVHVERDDTLWLYEDDEAASKAAERDGVKLIRGMDHVPDGVYLDTPENRAVIAAQLEKHTEYKDVHLPDKTLSSDEPPSEMGMCFGKG